MVPGDQAPEKGHAWVNAWREGGTSQGQGTNLSGGGEAKGRLTPPPPLKPSSLQRGGMASR